jgi:aminoglycoside 6-adenylyltransferase
MERTSARYDRLIERIIAWAEGEDNLRAVMMIGSQARKDHPADEWSDLDLILAAKDLRPLLESGEWLHHIGTVWITFVEPTPDGGFERRALFEGGLDVDFAPVAAERFHDGSNRPPPPLLADIVRRGFRFLVDKDGFSPAIRAMAKTPPPSATRPPESEFLNLVNDFWYHAPWTANHLRRGELWVAHSCCDAYLKNLLRRMIEWHAQAVRGEAVDTWMRGRFLEEWAAPEVRTALPHVFARHDAEEVWRALQATMDLFDGLARETAARWEFAYPSPAEEKARTLVETLFMERKTHDPK